MQSVNFVQNFNIQSPKTYRQNPSFGSISKDIFESGKLVYKINTCFFREDLDWAQIIEHIIKRKTPPKIYCYACSDGSEPYSIALALISKLGLDKAKKYFPIIARDINKEVISSAENRSIAVFESDFFKIEKHAKGLGKFFKKESGENWSTHRKCKVQKALADCVEFKKGDILEDAKNMSFDNSVLFFRNIWPYLDKSKKTSLLEQISHKFTPQSSLVVGDFDRKEIPTGYFNEFVHNVYTLA